MPDPIPGNQIPPLVIPNGKRCFYTGAVQSSGNQYIVLENSKGNQLFVLQGKSSSGGTPTPLGSGYFNADDPADSYTIKIGVNGGAKWSKVLWIQQELNMGSNIYCYQYTFIAEDYTDNDYNDSYCAIHWMDKSG